MRQNSLLPKRNEQIKQEYLSGLSLSRLAERYGLQTRESVRKILHKVLSVRPIGEYYQETNTQ